MEINMAIFQIIENLLRCSYTTISHIPQKFSSILLQVHLCNHFYKALLTITINSYVCERLLVDD